MFKKKTVVTKQTHAIETTLNVPFGCKYSTGSRLFAKGRSNSLCYFGVRHPHLGRNGTFRTASPRPLLPEQHGSRERFSLPAIAVHRPSDAYSSQLFIQRLASQRPSEAACFPRIVFFSSLLPGATFLHESISSRSNVGISGDEDKIMNFGLSIRFFVTCFAASRIK